MKSSDLKALGILGTAIVHARNRVIDRQVRAMPARLEKQLSLRATELSGQALEAILARLQAFRDEIGVSVASLPETAREMARNHRQELEQVLSASLGRRLEEGLVKLTGDCRAALEATGARAGAQYAERMVEAEKAFGQTLELLAKEYERRRLELVAEYEASRTALVKEHEIKRTESLTTVLADTYRGNWKADVLYRRGETFSFRGGWHLVLKDSLGRMPGKATITGPGAIYALLAAPGAPGPVGGGIAGAGTYVTPPLTAASAVQGQWTFSSGYMYWAVANGSVVRWAVTTAP